MAAGDDKSHTDIEGRDLSHPGALTLDVEKYRKYVDRFDLTDERKVELLQSLCYIMQAFVRYGFGLDSLHRCLPALADFSSGTEANGLENDETAQMNGGISGKEYEPT